LYTKIAENTINATPTRTTRILTHQLIELNPEFTEFTDEANEGVVVVDPKRDGPGVGPYNEDVGFDENNPIYVSLTKEVVLRHNGKTNRTTTKITDGNVL
jgi:hypothetical protein